MDQTQTHPRRKAKNRLVLALGIVVIVMCVSIALFFGERSPLIASGKIILPESMSSQAQGMRTLYIIVKDAESPMPMPWGAMSVTLHEEPNGKLYSFVLTRDNLRIMNPNATPPKKINIKARLDMDGMGGADTPGDIVGQLSNLAYGTENVEITLSDLIAESEPTPGP